MLKYLCSLTVMSPRSQAVASVAYETSAILVLYDRIVSVIKMLICRILITTWSQRRTKFYQLKFSLENILILKDFQSAIKQQLSLIYEHSATAQ